MRKFLRAFFLLSMDFFALRHKKMGLALYAVSVMMRAGGDL